MEHRLFLLCLCLLVLPQIHGQYSHKSAGIECDKKGDAECAIREFRKGVEEDPSDAKGWNNLGVALMRKYAPAQNQVQLNEALKAFGTSLALVPDAGTRKNWDDLTTYMKSRGMAVPTTPQSPPPQQLKEAQAKAQASQAGAAGATSVADLYFANGEYKKAVGTCKKSTMVIEVTEEERANKKLGIENLIRANRAIKICGVAILKPVLEERFLEKLRKRQKVQFGQYLRSIEEDKKNTNTTESNQRSPGRYEVRLPYKQPFIGGELIDNGLLTPILKANVGTRYEIDTFSSVTSLPNTPHQHWHQDTGHLFGHFDHHTPPHGLVVFVPLIDVPKNLGPTEFLLGSHIQCSEDKKEKYTLKSGWTLSLCPWAHDEFLPTLTAGSMVVFDVRIMHRGTANKSDKKRPMLYASFFREWYVDRVNFKDKQTKKFDDLTATERKLLTRVDSHQYILQLEEEFRKLGGDPDALQSNYMYTKHNLQ